MKKYLAVLVFLIGTMSAVTVLADQDAYNDCILKHLREAKDDAATAFIRQACYENYIGFLSLDERRKKYNECLLEYLVGVESFQAVMEIRNACSGKYLM